MRPTETTNPIRTGIAWILAAGILTASGYAIWKHQQPKFQDVTVELGQEVVSIRDFLTPHANAGQASFVTDPGTIDLSAVGTTPITLTHGRNQETVTLTVQDTTAPEAEFVETLSTSIDALPDAEDFVVSVTDESSVQIFFAREPVLPKDYTDTTVTVVVEDACGNQTSQDCVLSYTWLRESVAAEYGDTLTKADILYDPVRDASLVSQEVIDRINATGMGSYQITSELGERYMTCQVTVADTQGPKLKLRNKQIYYGGYVNLNSFLVSATDVSGVKAVRLMTQPDTLTRGKQTIVIEAEDTFGNITTGEALLWVATDYTPPVISGGTEAISTKKNTEPNYMAGISAVDAVDGSCQVTCNSDSVDLSTTGTYYVTYSATDASGNTAILRRRVIVEHDAEDTAQLVASIAAKLSNDPEKIRDYVRKTIRYNHDWGGEDPVWYGFTNKVGNCYVHALCLQAIFDLKGIESQLIWVTDKTHYWLIVNLDGTWRHIDATPGRRHSRYSLMTDATRYETLSGRDWDRSQWPACE